MIIWLPCYMPRDSLLLPSHSPSEGRTTWLLCYAPRDPLLLSSPSPSKESTTWPLCYTPRASLLRWRPPGNQTGSRPADAPLASASTTDRISQLSYLPRTHWSFMLFHHAVLRPVLCFIQRGSFLCSSIVGKMIQKNIVVITAATSAEAERYAQGHKQTICRWDTAEGKLHLSLHKAGSSSKQPFLGINEAARNVAAKLREEQPCRSRAEAMSSVAASPASRVFRFQVELKAISSGAPAVQLALDALVAPAAQRGQHEEQEAGVRHHRQPRLQPRLPQHVLPFSNTHRRASCGRLEVLTGSISIRSFGGCFSWSASHTPHLMCCDMKGCAPEASAETRRHARGSPHGPPACPASTGYPPQTEPVIQRFTFIPAACGCCRMLPLLGAARGCHGFMERAAPGAPGAVKVLRPALVCSMRR